MKNMTLNHGDRVSVFTDGNFELRGKVVGRYGLKPEFYEVQPDKGFSLSDRLRGVHISRLRKHYVAPHMVDVSAKHIRDEV